MVFVLFWFCFGLFYGDEDGIRALCMPDKYPMTALCPRLSGGFYPEFPGALISSYPRRHFDLNPMKLWVI